MHTQELMETVTGRTLGIPECTGSDVERDDAPVGPLEGRGATHGLDNTADEASLSGSVIITTRRGHVIHNTTLHLGSILALLYDDHGPARGHQDAFILGKRINGKASEKRLEITGRLGCDRELTDFRHLSHITFRSSSSQILCIIEFIESADLI
jgi:hypothetical protein